MILTIIAYYIGLAIGIFLTIFISYLFYQKFLIEQENNLIAQEHINKYLIHCKKVKDLHTFFMS